MKHRVKVVAVLDVIVILALALPVGGPITRVAAQTRVSTARSPRRRIESLPHLTYLQALQAATRRFRESRIVPDHGGLLRELGALRHTVNARRAFQSSIQVTSPTNQTVASLALPDAAFPTGSSVYVALEMTTGAADDSSQDWFRGNHGESYAHLGRQDGYYQAARWLPSGAPDTIYFHYQASIFSTPADAATAAQEGISYTSGFDNTTTGACNLDISCSTEQYSAKVDTTTYDETYAAFSVQNVLVEVLGDILPSASATLRSQYTQAFHSFTAAGEHRVQAAASDSTGIPTPTAGSEPSPTSTPEPTATSTPVATATPQPPAEVQIVDLATYDQSYRSSTLYYRNPTTFQLHYRIQGIASDSQGKMQFTVRSHVGPLMKYTQPIKVHTNGTVSLQVGGALVPGKRELQAWVWVGSHSAYASTWFTVLYPAGFMMHPKSAVAPVHRTLTARVESNQQAQSEKLVYHFDQRSFRAEGRQTGFFQSQAFGWPSISKKADAVYADLVSIYGSVQEAQSAFAAQKQGYDTLAQGCGSCDDTVTSASLTGAGLGDCCRAAYINVYNSGLVVNEILFVRGQSLVEVWLGFDTPQPNQAVVKMAQTQVGMAKALDWEAWQQQQY